MTTTVYRFNNVWYSPDGTKINPKIHEIIPMPYEESNTNSKLLSCTQSLKDLFDYIGPFNLDRLYSDEKQITLHRLTVCKSGVFPHKDGYYLYDPSKVVIDDKQPLYSLISAYQSQNKEYQDSKKAVQEYFHTAFRKAYDDFKELISNDKTNTINKEKQQT